MTSFTLNFKVRSSQFPELLNSSIRLLLTPSRHFIRRRNSFKKLKLSKTWRRNWTCLEKQGVCFGLSRHYLTFSECMRYLYRLQIFQMSSNIEDWFSDSRFDSGVEVWKTAIACKFANNLKEILLALRWNSKPKP